MVQQLETRSQVLSLNGFAVVGMTRHSPVLELAPRNSPHVCPVRLETPLGDVDCGLGHPAGGIGRRPHSSIALSSYRMTIDTGLTGVRRVLRVA